MKTSFCKIVGDTGFALSYAVVVNTAMMLTKENWVPGYLHVIVTHRLVWGFIMGSLRGQKMWREMTVTVIKTLSVLSYQSGPSVVRTDFREELNPVCHFPLSYVVILSEVTALSSSVSLIKKIHGGLGFNENSLLLRSFQSVKSSFQRKNWKKLEGRVFEQVFNLNLAWSLNQYHVFQLMLLCTVGTRAYTVTVWQIKLVIKKIL